MMATQTPIPLIPKDAIKQDADITALVNEDGYVLNSIHAEQYAAIVAAADVIGKHLSELYRPVPNEILRCLERAFEGEAHWEAITLPTITPLGLLERRFVIAFEPWDSINEKQTALVRMKLLQDELTEALDRTRRTDESLRERASHLISGEFSLDDIYIDALIDVTMRQSGFDSTIMLDEDGIVLDIFNLVATPPPVQEGGNWVEFMNMFDPKFQERWDFLLDHWQYINGIETIPLPDNTKIRVLTRVRVTQMRTAAGKRIVQVFARRLDRN